MGGKSLGLDIAIGAGVGAAIPNRLDRLSFYVRLVSAARY
jgi:hypothetical protein